MKGTATPGVFGVQGGTGVAAMGEGGGGQWADRRGARARGRGLELVLKAMEIPVGV